MINCIFIYVDVVSSWDLHYFVMLPAFWCTSPWYSSCCLTCKITDGVEEDIHKGRKIMLIPIQLNSFSYANQRLWEARIGASHEENIPAVQDYHERPALAFPRLFPLSVFVIYFWGGVQNLWRYKIHSLFLHENTYLLIIDSSSWNEALIFQHKFWDTPPSPTQSSHHQALVIKDLYWCQSTYVTTST